MPGRRRLAPAGNQTGSVMNRIRSVALGLLVTMVSPLLAAADAPPPIGSLSPDTL